MDGWDVLIVGAGPAGCAAAYDLAAAGRRVLLVDKAAFPRAKACAGGLTAKTLRALRYPVDPVVRKWIHALVLESGEASATLGRRGAPVCAMTVREELDQFCLRQTVERGAVFERIGAIEEIMQADDRVLVRLADGRVLAAGYLVGADGVHSRVRALTGEASWFRAGFAIEANVPHASAAEEHPLVFDFAAVASGYGWLFPRDTHVNVGLYVERAPLRRDARLDRAALRQYVDARLGVDRAWQQPVGQFLGLGGAGYRPQGRVLLVGDAAGFVDPLTGEGIYGAVRSGQAAAAAILASFGVLSDRRRWLFREPRLRAGEAASQNYARALAPLQQDLRVAEYAAGRFWGRTSGGFRLLQNWLVRRAALFVYAEGASLRILLQLIHAVKKFMPKV